MTPLLLQRAAERGWPVYFFGAKPGVAEEAKDLLEDRIPGLKVVGCRDGYFDRGKPEEAVAEIAAGAPGLLLVGMGNPLQEKWIAEHVAATGARLAVGVGAFFDFQTGHVKRAPAWMNKLGLEWVHRLLKEPKRMWRRYLLGNPLFLWRVLRQRRSG
jgi:exopolysaccharide biosynthesis WecB/TagA/CpsF family protein